MHIYMYIHIYIPVHTHKNRRHSHRGADCCCIRCICDRGLDHHPDVRLFRWSPQDCGQTDAAGRLWLSYFCINSHICLSFCATSVAFFKDTLANYFSSAQRLASCKLRDRVDFSASGSAENWTGLPNYDNISGGLSHPPQYLTLIDMLPFSLVPRLQLGEHAAIVPASYSSDCAVQIIHALSMPQLCTRMSRTMPCSVANASSLWPWFACSWDC